MSILAAIACLAFVSPEIPNDETGRYSRFVAAELEKMTFYNASKLCERYQKPFDFGVSLLKVVDAINRVHVAVYRKVEIRPNVSAAEWRKAVFEVANQEIGKLPYEPSQPLRHLLLAEASIAFVASSAGPDGAYCWPRNNNKDSEIQEQIDRFQKTHASRRKILIIEDHLEHVQSANARQGARRVADQILNAGRFDGACWVRTYVLDYFLQGLRTGDERFWTCGNSGDPFGQSDEHTVSRNPSHTWNWVVIGDIKSGFIGHCDLTWSMDIVPMIAQRFMGKVVWQNGALSGWYPPLTDKTAAERFVEMLPPRQIERNARSFIRVFDGARKYPVLYGQAIRSLNTHSSWDAWKQGAAYKNELYLKAKKQVDDFQSKLFKYHGL